MASGEMKRRREAAYRKGLEHGAAEADRFRRLGLHYMNALREIAIEDDIETAQLIACKALTSNPPPANRQEVD